jgi:hypothetical protein
MPTINFQRPYAKLLDKTGTIVPESKLLLVVHVPIEDVSNAKDYWLYDGEEPLSYSVFYTLLVFQKPAGDLFTVIRPSHGRHGSTYEYYKNLIGQTFKIEINAPTAAGLH